MGQGIAPLQCILVGPHCLILRAHRALTSAHCGGAWGYCMSLGCALNRMRGCFVGPHLTVAAVWLPFASLSLLSCPISPRVHSSPWSAAWCCLSASLSCESSDREVHWCGCMSKWVCPCACPRTSTCMSTHVRVHELVCVRVHTGVRYVCVAGLVLVAWVVCTWGASVRLGLHLCALMQLHTTGMGPCELHGLAVRVPGSCSMRSPGLCVGHAITRREMSSAYWA